VRERSSHLRPVEDIDDALARAALEPEVAEPFAAGAFSNQAETPYLDALEEFADGDIARLHVPGHKGGPGAGRRVVDALGERALRLDVPSCTHGIDIGAEPTPLSRAETLAADLYGAARTWFMVNGASQGNHAVCLALAQRGRSVVVQRNVHASTVSGLILSGLQPTFVAPELDLQIGVAHCITPEALEKALATTPGAAGVFLVSPTYYGAVADVAALAEVAHERRLPLIVDEAWGAHLALHEDLPSHAIAEGADIVLSGTHKILGSLTQSAMLHVSWEAERWIDADSLDHALSLTSSTSPNSLLLGSLDAARRHAAMSGRSLLEGTLAAIGEARKAIRRIPGLDVVDESIVGQPGVAAYDPLRLVVDVSGSGHTGFEIATELRDHSRIYLEFVEESLLVALFGLGGSARTDSARLIEGLRSAINALARTAGPAHTQPAFVQAPSWGALERSPRDAFLGPQEAVRLEAAVGRIAAESLAVYPPGIANVMPGERLSAPMLKYLREMREQGRRIRGARDEALRTIRVVRED
jgi:arginine decarboxylase